MSEYDPTPAEWHERAERALRLHPQDVGFPPPWWQPITLRRWKRRARQLAARYIAAALEGTKYDPNRESRPKEQA